MTCLTLAIDLLDVPSPATMVAIGGLSGTGKSTLAASLAPRLPGPCGAIVLRTDVIRKRLAGIPPEQRLAAQSYTKQASEKVYGRLFDLACRTLEAGQAVILDGVFLDPGERMQARAIARAHGTPFQGFWLETRSRAVLEHRITARTDDASDATVAVLVDQAALDPGSMEWKKLDAAMPLPRLRDACLMTLPTLSAARWPSPDTAT